MIFFDLKNKIEIKLFSDTEFDFKGTMSKTNYKGQGFFEAGVRKRDKKNYLSFIVVFDTKFIRASNQAKPDNNSPNLRVNVNNPWSSPRFNENDVFF